MNAKGTILAFTVLLVLTGELSGMRRHCPRTVNIDAAGPSQRKLRLVAEGNTNSPCVGDLEGCVFTHDLKFYCLNGEKGLRNPNANGKLLGYSEVEVSPHYTTVREHETETSIGEDSENNYRYIMNIEIAKTLTLNETKLEVGVCVLYVCYFIH